MSSTTSVTISISGQAGWTMYAEDFIHQADGHNCGPIACLKMMSLCNVVTEFDIKTRKQSFREIVMSHYKHMMEIMRYELVVSHKSNIKDIVWGDILCMCGGYEHINNKK
jgi:rhamnogalacturonyl hydrolase YesR